MKQIKIYNRGKENAAEGRTNGYSDFNMSKVETSSLTDGVWYVSRFLRIENECPNCFNRSAKTYKVPDEADTFTKWSGTYGKLSGVGPAWK